MISNIFADLRDVAKLFRDIRTARKEGTAIEIRKIHPLPSIVPGYSAMDTLEGHTILARCGMETYKAAKNAFSYLPDETKRSLAIIKGHYAERAHFWKALMTPYMTPVQLHTAMIALLSKYRQIVQKEAIA